VSVLFSVISCNLLFAHHKQFCRHFSFYSVMQKTFISKNIPDPDVLPTLNHFQFFSTTLLVSLMSVVH